MEFVLAALFAPIVGFGTAFSPCVLPVLPLALGGAATGGRRLPLGIAIGLAGSFAFAVLALAYAIAALAALPAVCRTDLAAVHALGTAIGVFLVLTAGRTLAGVDGSFRRVVADA